MILTHFIAFLLGIAVIPLLFHYGPDPVEDFISQYFSRKKE